MPHDDELQPIATPISQHTVEKPIPTPPKKRNGSRLRWVYRQPKEWSPAVYRQVYALAKAQPTLREGPGTACPVHGGTAGGHCAVIPPITGPVGLASASFFATVFGVCVCCYHLCVVWPPRQLFVALPHWLWSALATPQLASVIQIGVGVLIWRYVRLTRTLAINSELQVEALQTPCLTLESKGTSPPQASVVNQGNGPAVDIRWKIVPPDEGQEPNQGVWALIAAKGRGKTLSFAQAMQHTYTVVFQYKSLSTTRYESRFTVEGNTVQQEAYERLERLPNAKSSTARFRAVYNAPKAARTQHTGG